MCLTADFSDVHLYTTKWSDSAHVAPFSGVKMEIDFREAHIYTTKWGLPAHVAPFCGVKLKIDFCDVHFYTMKWREPLHASSFYHYKVEERFLRCPLLHSKRTHFENGPLQICVSVCTKWTFEVILVRKSQAKPPDRPNIPTGGRTRTVFSFDRGSETSGNSWARKLSCESPPVPSSLLICTSSRPPLTIILNRSAEETRSWAQSQ